jgi:hypothetical protein
MDGPLAHCEVPTLGETYALPIGPYSQESVLQDVYAVATADDGALFVAGCGALPLSSCRSLGTGGPCFLAKIDAKGRPDFVIRFEDGINDPLVVGLAADRLGGVVLGLEDDEGTTLGGSKGPGCLVERFDANGNNTFASSVGLDCTTNFSFAGNTGGHSVLSAGLLSGSGVGIVRVDERGMVQSSRNYDGYLGTPLTMAVRDDGVLLVAGYASGPLDLGSGLSNYGGISTFLATYDEELKLRDLLVVPNNGGGGIQAVATAEGFAVTAVLSRDGVDLGGGSLPYFGKQDILFAKFTERLQHIFSRAYGDPSNQDTAALCVDANGAAGWTGYPGSSIDFGTGHKIGNEFALLGGFIASLGPDGVALDATGTLILPRIIGCTPGALVLAGSSLNGEDLGAGMLPAGGFIVRRPRP